MSIDCAETKERENRTVRSCRARDFLLLISCFYRVFSSSDVTRACWYTLFVSMSRCRLRWLVGTQWDYTLHEDDDVWVKFHSFVAQENSVFVRKFCTHSPRRRRDRERGKRVWRKGDKVFYFYTCLAKIGEEINSRWYSIYFYKEEEFYSSFNASWQLFMRWI